MDSGRQVGRRAGVCGSRLFAFLPPLTHPVNPLNFYKTYIPCCKYCNIVIEIGEKSYTIYFPVIPYQERRELLSLPVGPVYYAEIAGS